jgi:hypothetical protein
VHEIEVDIVEAQALQALLESFLHSRMVSAPELGGDEDVFSLDPARKGFLQALSHLVFVAVAIRCSGQLASLFQERILIPASMCLYPIDSAYDTAFLTSPGPDCQVPRPKAGISAPVFNLNRVSAMMGKFKLKELRLLRVNRRERKRTAKRHESYVYV